jgi:hypothetical protein
MTGSERLPGKIVGHEPGAFYHRLAQTLGGYVRDVVDELARRGMVGVWQRFATKWAIRPDA